MMDETNKKYSKFNQDVLKSNITSDRSTTSTDSLKNAVTDTVLNNEKINNVIPVQKIQDGLKQAETVKNRVQSNILSSDNLSIDGLMKNEQLQSKLPTAHIDKATSLKNNMLADPDLPIQLFRKRKLQQPTKEILSDTVNKTGLYFAVQIGDLPLATFDVVEFKLDEALSGLFTLTLTLSSKDADIDLQQQLLKKTKFILYTNGQKQRTINGIVEKAERGDSGFKRTYYTFVIRPPFWQLTLTKDSRIYHFKSVPDIINEILQDFNIIFDKQLMDPHPVREYTTMKRESYYGFISRLAAEEGIAFWHEENQLFYSDSHLGMTAGLDLIYNPHPQAATKEQVISGLTFACSMRPTETKVKDYRYSHPDVLMDAKTKTNKALPAFEVYDSYGRYNDEKTAQQFSQYRLEALQSDSETGQATSNSIQLMPGKIFIIHEHPTKAMNDRWQIVNITHKGTLPQSLDNESDGKPATLTNEFTFIPGRNDWRPLFIHKPQADGDEVATVVGPAGEEIYVNEDGAVKIHFHWNRYDAADENASCWVRVLQNWNGDGFGFLSIPRIGQEVLVGYINGDIDRPIIMGTTYNGNNRPPLDLPAAKTQMSIKSKTHKGEGFNELRFDDDAGKEGMFLHAQKDMNTKVLNDRSTTVLASHTENVAASQTITVGEAQIVTVGKDQVFTVSGSHALAVQGISSTLVGGDCNIQSKGKITIASPTAIRIDCGASAIELNSNGSINLICKNFNFFAEVNGHIAALNMLEINSDDAKAGMAAESVDGNIEAALTMCFPK